MENKILEVAKNFKRLPDYVFLRKYSFVYFFEMPMRQNEIVELINQLSEMSTSKKYSGYLIDPFEKSLPTPLILKNGIIELHNNKDSEEKEITWSYSIGHFIGANWELYYEFNGEKLLVGFERHKDIFDHFLRRRPVLMRYNYCLEDLIHYFKTIATSNFKRPLDKESVLFYKKLKQNYHQSASCLME